MSDLVMGLMRSNLHSVFAERDETVRLAAIERTYADDVLFTDPEGTVSGREVLNQKARELLERSPGFVFAEDGPIYADDTLGCLAWRFGPDGQPAVARGIDVASISDGRIATLHTIIVD